MKGVKKNNLYKLFYHTEWTKESYKFSLVGMHTLIIRKSNIQILLMLVLLSFVAGCSSSGPSTLNLMPAPSIYNPEIEEALNITKGALVPPTEIFYATNRAPADSNSTQYSGERGGVLRFGGARVMMGKGGYTFEEVREISLLKNRSEEYPLSVTDVREYGLFSKSLNSFYAEEVLKSGRTAQDDQFAKRINETLASSSRKDVYIYVHGYKVDFDNPILVASELWHFLGYQGAFVAFSWPSTPRTMAYLADLETSEISSYQLRRLISFLSENTDAERIHILGYSVGARIVVKSLAQLSLTRRFGGEKLRIGHVMLLGGDLDADMFGANISEGLLDIVDDITVYISDNDQALAFSGWVFNRSRLGQLGSEISLTAKRFLEANPKLSVVDVTNDSDASSGIGHAYFRKSPRVSSDILMTLKYNLKPGERGLKREDYGSVWTFPENYMDKLHERIMLHIRQHHKNLPE
ncbi:MAG: hypothetical protein BA863_08100 [Desulfovibrio sp. S3730MH75]|nr:MAG: hypothetical protein BA863_08100 [Desulfovibrio sp. S3730MH75]